MKTPVVRWLPVVVLGVGCVLSLGAAQQLTPELTEPLSEALPDSVEGLPGFDAQVSEGEAAVAGFTDYALRVYQSVDTTAQDSSAAVLPASIYLGFYDKQTRGRTIHSPKNCLPGAGWEALQSGPERVPVGADTITVNRYLLQNGNSQALVLYWYQGRGRVAYNEYLVKWDLLRDAILKRRTDEALVRIVVNVEGSVDAALAQARKMAADLKPAVDEALPS
jgi:EpsI family protein